MQTVTKQQVLDHLKTIKDPDFEGDIVSLGLVSDIFIADNKVFFSITVPANRAEELEPLRIAAERAVRSINGVLFGDGTVPGPVTDRLMQAYVDLVGFDWISQYTRHPAIDAPRL